jgi:hypothetical protein
MSFRMTVQQLLPLAWVASASIAADNTFDKHFDAPAGGRLSVDTDDGSVAVVGHDSRDITIHVETEGAFTSKRSDERS